MVIGLLEHNRHLSGIKGCDRGAVCQLWPSTILVIPPYVTVVASILQPYQSQNSQTQLQQSMNQLYKLWHQLLCTRYRLFLFFLVTWELGKSFASGTTEDCWSWYYCMWKKR